MKQFTALILALFLCSKAWGERYPAGSGFDGFTGYTSGDLSQASDWTDGAFGVNEAQVGTNALTTPALFYDGTNYVAVGSFDTTGISYIEVQLTLTTVGGADDLYTPSVHNGTTGNSLYSALYDGTNVCVLKFVTGTDELEGCTTQAVSSGDDLKITVAYDTPSAGQNTITIYIDTGGGFSSVTSAVDNGTNFNGTSVHSVGQPGILFRRLNGNAFAADDFAASSVTDGIENGEGGGGTSIPITLQNLQKGYGPQRSQQLGGLMQ